MKDCFSALLEASRIFAVPPLDPPEQQASSFFLPILCGVPWPISVSKHCLHTRHIFQKALATETEKVIAKFGILEIQFKEPVICDCQHLATFCAFNCLRS